MYASDYLNTPPLSVRRKADRAKMAAAIRATAEAAGASFTLEAENGRELLATVNGPRGLSVSLWLRADALDPDVFCLPWHFASDAPEGIRLAPAFGDVRFGDVNPHHARKCTMCVEGFGATLAVLASRLRMAADGSAFEESSR